jgi:hypothetical protein
MCASDHHPWDLPTGLPCLGDGPGHAHTYAASDAADGHDASEARAEASRG